MHAKLMQNHVGGSAAGQPRRELGILGYSAGEKGDAEQQAVQMYDVKQGAEAVKNDGVEIFAIGFGDASTTTINALATEPASMFAYMASSLADVRSHALPNVCVL